MLKTYDRHFAHYSIYAANNGDILILGTQQQSIAIPNNFIFNIPRLKMLLKKVGINNPQDLYVRHIIDKRLFHDYLTQYPIPANSDYFPIVDTNAVKSRFLNQSVLELKSLGYFLPFNLFHSNYPQINGDKITVRADDYTRTELAKNAVRYRDALLHLKKTRDIRTRLRQYSESTRVGRRFIFCWYDNKPLLNVRTNKTIVGNDSKKSLF